MGGIIPKREDTPVGGSSCICETANKPTTLKRELNHQAHARRSNKGNLASLACRGALKACRCVLRIRRSEIVVQDAI